MKKVLLFATAIFAFWAFNGVAMGQIVTKYQQGFETTGETYSYSSVSGTIAPQTTLYSSGDRALKLSHTATEAVLELDTIDLTDNGAYSSVVLEFFHICDVHPQSCQSANDVAVIEVKALTGTGNEQWQTLTGNYYDVAWGGGTTEFGANSCFSNQCYAEWQNSTMSNTYWKRERFKLYYFVNSLALQNRKLLIRFKLRPKVSNYGAANAGWYLDNISVKASPQSMDLPVMTMLAYPELGIYPTSRGTRLSMSVQTNLTAGMAQDSIYVQYRLGTGPNVTTDRQPMSPVNVNSAGSGTYEFYVPFCGYDTTVSWRIVAKDATLNHNTVTFPQDESAWLTYTNVRGKGSSVPIVTSGLVNESKYPFPSQGSSKAQFYYDSSELAAAGVMKGALTQLQFTAGGNVSNSNRPRFQIKMANVDDNFQVSAQDRFSTNFQTIVYDSALVLTQNSGTVGTINLQDTFFYAGKGILMTVAAYNPNFDPLALPVKAFTSTAQNHKTIYLNYAQNLGMATFTSEIFNNGISDNRRPNFIFRISPNAPLIHDCGIGGFVTPNDSTEASAVGNNNVVVSLHNYGADVMNGIRIWFQVDGGTHQYYDWTGTLQGGQSVNVTVSTTQQYAAGYHEMRAWVDDSITVSGTLYRDHEPLNDTLWTRFISCNGPMSGTRQVGGSGADYDVLEHLLFALSQCGVNGPLTVKLAPGYYTPETFYSIPGTSAENYVKFEPLSTTTNDVTFLSSTGATSTVNSLINLQQANHIWLNRINFQANTVSNPTTYLVRLGINSTGCKITNCSFHEVQGGAAADLMATTAIIYSGGCDSLTVSGNTFTRGTMAISMVGPAPDNMAHGNVITGNTMSQQGVNGIVVRNQVGAVVDSNTVNDVYANSSYLILLQDCSGATKVTRNQVYVTSGAACIGATNLLGTSTDMAIVANNMLVSADAGTSNMLTTPLNIITADYTKVVFNSIRLVAPTRTGIAAATFGGGTLENSYFYNNIVSCYDTANFAFNYIPTTDASNYIGYNIYYSQSELLNKYDGVNCLTLAAWTALCGMDANSQNVNPAFLMSNPMDLRSYSQNVRSHGVPISDVTVDLYGTVRDTTAPCVGAFEFYSLPYDFEITEVIEPALEYCNVPSSSNLRVVLKNSGVNAFNPDSSNLKIVYSRTSTPGTMAPGQSGYVNVNRVIPPNDTIIFSASAGLTFPTNGIYDSTYSFCFWLTSSIDPNPANDTTLTTVTAHYHPAAPDSIQMQVNYGTAATIQPTQGVDVWYPNVYTTGTTHKSRIYWYQDSTDTEPFYVGSPMTTGLLYTDTTIYMRQRRDYGLMKITEVQIKNNGVGVTSPQQVWMNSATVFAVELTNVGDVPAYIDGDTMRIVSNTNSLNKILRLPNVAIPPHQALVIQWRASIGDVDSTVTLPAVNLSPAWNANFCVLYKDSESGTFTDAVAFNSITSQAAYQNLNLPSTVWSGPAIALNNTTAGVTRTSWPQATSTVSNTANFWQIADSTHSMNIGTVSQNLIRYEDNGCLGDVAPVHITMINLPDVDLALDSIVLPSGCGITVEPVTVTIHNRGSQNTGSIIAHYSIDDSLVCSDTLSSLNMNGYVSHTFSQQADFTMASGNHTFNVMAWVEHNTNDNAYSNDTTRVSVYSSYQPGVQNVYQYDTVDYGSRAVLQALTTPTDSLLWYDRNMNVLDTTNVLTTDYIYVDDTFYVSGLGIVEGTYHVGELASLTSPTAYPSPYNPNKKYVKEQYLYRASDLAAIGRRAGEITSLSFYFDTIRAAAGTMTFTDYTISLGLTTDESFSSNNNWHTVAQYYAADSLTIVNADRGWIKHELDSAFTWDGEQNIVVQVTRSIVPNITQGARTAYTNAGNNLVLFKNDNNNSVVDYTGNGSRSANRPDIQFGFVDYDCEGPTLPVYVEVINVPSADASIAWSPADTVSIASCGATPLQVVLGNTGGETYSSYTIDYWIDDTHGVYNGTTAVASHDEVTLTIAQPTYTPGRHVVRAAITLTGDTIQTNDTITKMFNVRFCAGTYTIGTSGDYPDFTTAIDTLHNAGVAGAVIFQVMSGTYNEQLVIGAVEGTSTTNTVTFESATGNSDDVMLKYAPIQANNYVVLLDGAENIYFRNMNLYAYKSTNNSTYATVVRMQNTRNIHFEGNEVRVNGTVNNANATCFVVGENVHYLYLDSNWVDSGYYSVKSQVTIADTTYGMYFRRNQFTNFWSQGVSMRKVNEVYLANNEVTSGVNVNSRALTGIYIAEHNGAVTITANNVVLNDNRNGGKRGIYLSRIYATNVIRSKVYTNMTACYGTGVAGVSPNGTAAGIYIDSCNNMNVYYNSCRVFAGNNATNSRALSVESISTGIYVMNNIFANVSRGYAYYVKQAGNIGNSNYNSYYNNDTLKLAHWGGTDVATLAELRTANSQDANSIEQQPYFLSPTDLHLSIGSFCEKAQYNTEVPLDIDDEIRPQIPSPTLGADEFFRPYHNIAIMEILEPLLDVTDNVESDTLRVVVKLTNDGTSTETNLTWYAQVEGTSPLCRTPNRTIDELQPQEVIIDTAYIPMPIGVIDTQTICVYFPMTNDAVSENNTMCQEFFLDPAYNVEGTLAIVDVGDGCRKQNTQVQVKITNKGRKPIPTNIPLTIGFQAIQAGTDYVVTTLPLQWTETYTLTSPLDTLASVELPFSQTANLYPTGVAKDVVIRCRAWATHIYDQKPLNDTSSYINVTSKYTPSAPVGVDLTLPYATWDTIFASHTDVPPTGSVVHRPVRWHRDSVAEPFFAPSTYAASCWWETPQYFHDSVYYLSCVSSSGCTSYYSQVHVNVNAQLSTDVAVEAIEDPIKNMVYMYQDSVKVRIINYGTQPVSNIPVVYRFMNHQGALLQQVEETCTATIQPGGTYVYCFDSLISIPNWSASQAYRLRAWTNLMSDGCHGNDTLRGVYGGGSTTDNGHRAIENYYFFYAAPQYSSASSFRGYQTPVFANKPGLDITRVAFNSLEHTVSPAGNDYFDFANITNPLVPVLHLRKGITDTMIVEIANSDDCNDTNTMAYLEVLIDANRDGAFQPDTALTLELETMVGADSATLHREVFFEDTVYAGRPVKFALTIPEWIRTGYMRMRVFVNQGSTKFVDCNDDDVQFGQVQDYLLYVEDVPEHSVDVAASYVHSPRNCIIDTSTHVVNFVMTNKGSESVNSVHVNYAFIDGHPTAPGAMGNFDWTGQLDPGQSTVVSLPDHNFFNGTTDVKICLTTVGDDNTTNDTLWYQYHLFDVHTLYFVDSFESADEWYAPRGYSDYDQNVWQRGFPQKQSIVACVSDSNVWATNLTGMNNYFGRGNVSYLYSPVFDIAQIRPDTIQLYLSTSLSENSYVRLEYYDYLGRWIMVGSGNDTLTNWSNSSKGWTGITSGGGYELFRFPTNWIAGNFQQRLQLRFVFYTSPDADPCDGAAVDNFKLGRAQRDIDLGVTAIVHPTAPKFGQTISPKVVIHNYGYDTIYEGSVAYMQYGAHLPVMETFHFNDGLAPGANGLYTFQTPFVVLNNFPDTFQIAAFTKINVDIYRDNDSTIKDFYLSPLDNDMAMVDFISPLDHIVAGDSITITTRLRNYGMAPVDQVNVTYVFNNTTTVTETVDFATLTGNSLGAFGSDDDAFNYSFHQKVRASMGLMHLTAYVELSGDDYLFNDTITKDVMGLSAITDLKAREIVIDTTPQECYYIQVTVDNVGARAANDFEIGFWYYNDTNTIVRQTYHSEHGLPALETLYFKFDTALVRHSQYYRYVTAYVHALDDNDRTNDTTQVITPMRIDLRPVRVLVEENREDTCSVRMEVENVGNAALVPVESSTPGMYQNVIHLKATINGQTIRRNNICQVLNPGEVRTIELYKSIPKSSTRTYEGSGTVDCAADKNSENNQTSIVDVLNYFEGIPFVTATDGMELEQNVPNPFHDKTRVDFRIPQSGNVRLFVMDAMGRMVYQHTDFYSEGKHSVNLDDLGLSSGVYYYGIEMDDSRLMRKMVVR